MSAPLRIAYTAEYLDWRLGDGHPTVPERARLAVRRIVDEALAEGRPVTLHRPDLDWDGVAAAAERVHGIEYLARVRSGRSGEWSGVQPRLGEVAALMFQGTVDLVDLLVADRAAGSPGVYFNPQGAKHHAHRDRASGFCVLNDMAWAADRFTRDGLKVLYIDWDAHHGDGVEALLRSDPRVVTASIHDGSIFPGTGRSGHDPAAGVYNWSLESGSGDQEFHQALHEILGVADDFGPDVVLLAAGADGHQDDPLSTLAYGQGGFTKAAWAVGRWCGERRAPLLIGGAGGYRPLDHTPEAWAWTVANAYDAFVSVDVTGVPPNVMNVGRQHA